MSADEVAVVRLQSAYRGHLGRILAARQRARLEQRRLDDEQEQEEQANREKAAAAAREAEATKKREAEKRRQAQREAQLRTMRDRRCTVEVMCQGLTRHEMAWEEEPSKLLELTSECKHASWDLWIGDHATQRAARRKYLSLARRWHPDKWALQGEDSVAVATEITKHLVRAYEQAMRELPRDPAAVSCEDEDEEREVNEFASWVGISFEGMATIYNQRKGVKERA